MDDSVIGIASSSAEVDTKTGRRTVFTPAHARIEKAKTVAAFETEMLASPGDAEAIRAFVATRHPRLWARIAAEQPPQIIAADK